MYRFSKKSRNRSLSSLKDVDDFPSKKYSFVELSVFRVAIYSERRTTVATKANRDPDSFVTANFLALNWDLLPLFDPSIALGPSNTSRNALEYIIFCLISNAKKQTHSGNTFTTEIPSDSERTRYLLLCCIKKFIVRPEGHELFTRSSGVHIKKKICCYVGDLEDRKRVAFQNPDNFRSE